MGGGGVGGGVGGGGVGGGREVGWVVGQVGSQRQVTPFNRTVCSGMSTRSASIGPDMARGPKRSHEYKGKYQTHTSHPALHGSNCLSHDFTWSIKPTLEQTSQVSLIMKQCTGSV